MIGVYGGTFDPVHFGHLRTALEVQEIFALDELRLIPCAQPPHRSHPYVSAAFRLHMLQVAVAGQTGFFVDDRELRRSGPSYMVDTLASLRAEVGAHMPLLLFIGADAFAGLERWHQWQRLFDHAHVVVMTRPASPTPLLSPFLALRHSDDKQRLKNQPAGYILLQNVTPLEISATQIRKLIGERRDPRFLLPDTVLAFIRHHHLYQTC
ncbi:MAG: nicotinate-nucleotide adenylyltransferase [Gammaproteobacteria bacterium]